MKPIDLFHLLEKIKERRKSERDRFKRIYDIDFEDLSNYNLVIDSALFLPEKIVELIMDGIELYG